MTSLAPRQIDLCSFSSSKLKKAIASLTIVGMPAAINLCILPIQSRLMDQEQVGKFVLLQSILYAFVPLATFETDSYILAFWPKSEKKNKEWVMAIAATSTSIASFAVYSLLYFFNPLSLENSHFLTSLTSACLIALLSFNRIATALGRVAKKEVSLAINQLVSAIIIVIFTFVLLYFAHYGLVGRLMGWTLGSAALTLSLAYVLRSHFDRASKPQKAFRKDYLSFAGPLVLHSYSGFLFTYADRLILSKFVNYSELGSYGIASQLVALASVLVTTLSFVWTPKAYELIRSQNSNLKGFIKNSKLVSISVAALVIVSTIVTYFIAPIILGNRFPFSGKIFLILSLGTLFNGLYFSISPWFFALKETKLLAKCTVFSGIVGTTVTGLLAYSHGATGAACGSSLTWLLFLVSAFLVFYRKSIKIHTK